MINTLLNEVSRRGAGSTRRVALAATFAVAMLGASVAQAFPSLNLTTTAPDIESSFINVDYVGNNSGGTLSATGFANVLTPPGAPTGTIFGGTFNINAILNFDAQTAAGSLTIGGTIAALGFNTGTLLTGTLLSTAMDPTFGAGTGDPLEFLFAVTGGDAASLYGDTAGTILSFSGYSGSFGSDFSSASFGALADTFGTSVTEPGTLGLLMLGGLLVAARRKRLRCAALA